MDSEPIPSLGEAQQQAWDQALHSLSRLFAAVLAARGAAAPGERECQSMFDAVQDTQKHLRVAAKWSRTRCSPDRCDMSSSAVQCELCSCWYCRDCCCELTGVCDECVQLEETDGEDSDPPRKRAKASPDDDEETWLCVECGCDMGSCNPRQYCGKHTCLGLV